MQKNESRQESEKSAFGVPAWMDWRLMRLGIVEVSVDEMKGVMRRRALNHFVIRVCVVALPILVFFSLPALGVQPGGAFSFLAFLLLAWPLFVFEYDEEWDSMRRAFRLARIAHGEEGSR